MAGRRQWRNAALVGLVALGALAACGCPPANLFAWMFAPRHPKEMVKAEYPLKAERLVIVTYAGTEILFDDPTAPLEVSSDLVNEILRSLGTNVKSIIHPVQVVRWQESNLEWPNMLLVDIAKAFEADTLLYVELERYTMMEDRSANLYRGRIRARIQVAETKAERNPVYETTVETVFPPDRPVGVLESNERTIRLGTNLYFARDVIGKFHDHEIEVKGGRP
jgi:hypothetical protein